VSLLLGLALSLFAAVFVRAVMPYNSATVTRVENKVSYGQVAAGKSKTRPANAQDVVRTTDFLLSETESRAELKYDDGTIVRLGQNTVFSFDANTRTLNLEKGTFVFYIPKGSGGATIKTPSITAAITGTVGKVSIDTIAIIEGTIELKPSGRLVHAGQFARRNADGSITIGNFDPAKGLDGKLMTFNGPLPGLPEGVGNTPTFSFTPPTTDDDLARGSNLPSGVMHFNPPPAVRANPTVKPPPPPPNNNSNSPY
jgi:hypothetical protein